MQSTSASIPPVVYISQGEVRSTGNSKTTYIATERWSENLMLITNIFHYGVESHGKL